ncbi:MAG: tetratricopeptide repeat protein [Chitinivibrionales bacterium]|nr:tetratricopeptide repeat protein [Chitinivibrionales bacterium]
MGRKKPVYHLQVSMNKFAIFLLAHIILLTFFAQAQSQQHSFTAEIRQHFEWGEYNNLIEKLDPYLATPPDSSDSSLIAAYHTYLGVAYFDRGEIGDAREQFERALMYDPSAKLEKDFVSQPMLDLFDGVLEDLQELKKQQKEAKRKDSLIVTRERELKKSITTVTRIQRSWIMRKKQIHSITAVSLYVLAGIMGGVAVYQYGIAEENYKHYKYASDNGYLDDRRKYRRIVLRADILTISAASAAVLSALSGAVFTRNALQRKKQLDSDSKTQLEIEPDE